MQGLLILIIFKEVIVRDLIFGNPGKSHTYLLNASMTTTITGNSVEILAHFK